MYSLKVILLLNCARQGDLNSKSMSLDFFKVSQSLCSSLLYSRLPPPTFFLQVKYVSFICGIWRDIFPRSLLGNTKSLKYTLLWYFAVLTPPTRTFYMFFLLKMLINSARNPVLWSWKKLYYNLWGFWNSWALSSNYFYLKFFFIKHCLFS